jgi:protein ImuB
MNVVSWAWVRPPRDRGLDGRGRGAGRPLAPITPGMSLSEAMAVLALACGSRACHLAEVDHDDPASDHAALVRLARWCRRFSPTVMLEESSMLGNLRGKLGQECIHLDVTGTAGFFGGEATLARTAVWALAARGVHARAAIADTLVAASAAVRHTDLLASGTADHALVGQENRKHENRKQRWVVVPSGETAAWLAPLPVAALRFTRDVLATLHEVGVESVGEMLRLPSTSLASRFPPQVSCRRAQLLGTLADSGDSLASGTTELEELPQAMESFEVPVSIGEMGEDAVAAVIERLLAVCVAPLIARGEGVLALQVRLEVSSTGHAATVMDVGLFRPSGSVRHLLDLVRLRMSRVRPPREITALAVNVVAAGPIACRQQSLFADFLSGDASSGGGSETAESRNASVDMLLDRLLGRLGGPGASAAVFVPQSVADPQPEHAWIASPHGVARSPEAGQSKYSGGRRPIWMPPRPVPLDTHGCDGTDDGVVGSISSSRRSDIDACPFPKVFRFGGRVQRVVAAHGPERIETAWWRGPTVRRDYYVLETDSGERFWVFRRLGRRSADGWFLHGVFA